MAPYDKAFYGRLADSAQRSARRIVPLVINLVAPVSAIDIGCGAGAWLSVFAEHGVKDIIGVDGDFLPRELLQIPSERYIAFDLTRPYRSDRHFDLVLSLEVAEHLDAATAESFVESLVRLAPAVLFSAAIPGQGGTHHVNEQWQDYWASLFKRHDYVAIDYLRNRVWNDPDVAWWYAQNLLLYCERGYVAERPALAAAASSPSLPLNIVHPRKLAETVWKERLAHAALQLARVLPPDAAFLLVDGDSTGEGLKECGRALNFPQPGGAFLGYPPDSQAALAETQRLWPAVSHIVVVEPVFWWFETYASWAAYLRANTRPILETDLLKVFEIRRTSEGSGGGA